MKRRPGLITRGIRYGWIGFCILFVAGCHWDMYNQPKYQTYEPSSFFEDGRSSRPIVEGSVAVGDARTDEYFYNGVVDGQEVDAMPFPVTQELLLRGQQQYNIFCAPCHGQTGYAQSVVAQRGAIVPANLHQQRLRDAPIGHFYNVTTNGYRYMYGYASRIEPEDRWAIAAYVRALQLSQDATIEDVSPEARRQLESQ